MKCEKCGNEYPSQYYFSTPTICAECFAQLPPDEQKNLYEEFQNYGVIDNTHNRIGFGRRFSAAIIDMIFTWILIIIGIFVTGLNDLFAGQGLAAFKDPVIMQELGKGMFPISLFIGIIYYSMEILLAATPGKLILGIQIASDDGKYASYWKLFLRFSIKNISSYIGVIYLLTSSFIVLTINSYIPWAIFICFLFVLGGNRTALYDKIVKTAVFKRNTILD